MPSLYWEDVGLLLLSWQLLSIPGIGSALVEWQLLSHNSTSSFCIWDHLSESGHVEEAEPRLHQSRRSTLSCYSHYESFGRFRWGHLNHLLVTSALGHFWWGHLNHLLITSALSHFWSCYLSYVLTILCWRLFGWVHFSHRGHFLPHILENAFYAV